MTPSSLRSAVPIGIVKIGGSKMGRGGLGGMKTGSPGTLGPPTANSSPFDPTSFVASVATAHPATAPRQEEKATSEMTRFMEPPRWLGMRVPTATRVPKGRREGSGRENHGPARRREAEMERRD